MRILKSQFLPFNVVISHMAYWLQPNKLGYLPQLLFMRFYLKLFNRIALVCVKLVLLKIYYIFITKPYFVYVLYTLFTLLYTICVCFYFYLQPEVIFIWLHDFNDEFLLTMDPGSSSGPGNSGGPGGTEGTGGPSGPNGPGKRPVGFTGDSHTHNEDKNKMNKLPPMYDVDYNPFARRIDPYLSTEDFTRNLPKSWVSTPTPTERILPEPHFLPVAELEYNSSVPWPSYATRLRPFPAPVGSPAAWGPGVCCTKPSS